jgi:LysM repeat protein
LAPEDFYPLNPELAANPNSLYIGQEIRIPNCATPTPEGTLQTQPGAEATTPAGEPATQGPPAPAGMQTYVVQPGDNLFRIALRFGVTVQDIVDATPFLVNENTVIRPGDVLYIPAPPQ